MSRPSVSPTLKAVRPRATRYVSWVGGPGRGSEGGRVEISSKRRGLRGGLEDNGQGSG